MKQAILPLAAEGRRHVCQIDVAEAVAVIGIEHLFACDMLADGPQALADIPPDASIDHGDTPVFLWIAEKLHLAAKARDDAVGVGLRPEVQEEILDDIGLVAKAQHEVFVAELAVVVHQMPQDRLVADRDHRLGNSLGHIPDAGSEASAKEDRFHLSTVGLLCRRSMKLSV